MGDLTNEGRPEAYVSLQRRIDELEKAIEKMSHDLKIYKQYMRDTSEGFEHLPSCDSNGCNTEEGCPVTNAVAAFRILRERLAETHRQLVNAQSNNHDRNIELDALHYVWCDGGCNGGTHRFGEHPPLTPDIVAAAERNARRLRRWYVNNAGKTLPGTTEARIPAWREADIAIHTSYVEQSEAELREVVGILKDLREWHRGEYQSNSNINARADAILQRYAPNPAMLDGIVPFGG